MIPRKPLVSRTVRLREAASTIFALVTLLPLLVLLYFLHKYDALSEPEAQIGLALAVLLAVLGFFMLQQIMGRLSRMARALTASADSPPAVGASADASVSGLGHVAEIGQIGSAFARMLEDLRTSTDRLEDLVFKLGALSEIVELAARVQNIQELLSLVLERSMRTVRATGGSIMLLDRERQRLRVVVARGFGDARAGAESELGEGVAGTVAQGGESVLVEDVTADPRFAGDTRWGTGSGLCLPVRLEERIIGVINLAKQNGAGTRGFGPTDLQFLQTLVSHVAYSLDNARLLDETRETASRLELALRDLQTAQTRLVEGETLRAMGQMASGMAHHLNNLLAVVSGRIQLLLMQVKESPVRRPLEIARQATEDAAEVVRRVLEFTARQPVMAAGSADLNQLVREVLELTRPRWHDQAHLDGISIEVVLHLGDVPPVAGEVSGLREVLMNLVLNAVDAMPNGGRLAIRTWTADDDVGCDVSDTGLGMSEEVRHRAFEPFFTTKGPQGVGLGLSVSHAIVERHRGTMTIDSVPGRGTTVTFQLPRAAVEAAYERPRPDAVIMPRRILLVDDEAEVRAALADSLAAAGHIVVQAAYGRQGLECLEAGESVDVVLTDLGMPDMTGWDLARAIKARWPSLPVGLITGWGLKPQATPEQRQSVDFIIAKPYSVEALLGAIADAAP